MNKEQVLAALEEAVDRIKSGSSEWIDDSFVQCKRPTLGDDLISLLNRVEASGYSAPSGLSKEYVWMDIDVNDPDYDAYAEEVDEETGEEVYLPYQTVIDRIVSDYQGEPLIVAVVVNGHDAGGLQGFIEQIPKETGNIEFDIVHVERGEDDAGQPTAKITQDTTVAVEGREVLLLTWAIGTGCTAAHLVAHLRERKAGTVGVCAVLDDMALRTVPVRVDYRVVEFERRAVIGVARGEGFNFPCIVI